MAGPPAVPTGSAGAGHLYVVGFVRNRPAAQRRVTGRPARSPGVGMGRRSDGSTSPAYHAYPAIARTAACRLPISSACGAMART
jgi:hypothetical protein